jgi:hypothetical protein
MSSLCPLFTSLQCHCSLMHLTFLFCLTTKLNWELAHHSNLLIRYQTAVTNSWFTTLIASCLHYAATELLQLDSCCVRALQLLELFYAAWLNAREVSMFKWNKRHVKARQHNPLPPSVYIRVYLQIQKMFQFRLMTSAYFSILN